MKWTKRGAQIMDLSSMGKGAGEAGYSSKHNVDMSMQVSESTVPLEAINSLVVILALDLTVII